MCEMDTEQIIEEIKRLKQENAELKGKIDGYKRALDIIGSSLSEHLSPTAWGFKENKGNDNNVSELF